MAKKALKMASLNDIKDNGVGNSERGLAAVGVSGKWEVALDETTSPPERWFLQIEGPSIYLSFEVESPGIIDEAILFLECCDNGDHAPIVRPCNCLTFSKSGTLPIQLVRDNESNDRLFLVAGSETVPTIRMTTVRADLKDLLQAMREVKQELSDAD